MRVAYIVSMNPGLTAWTYREIDVLCRSGVEIYGYPVRWISGLYMPKPEWHFRRPSPLRTLFAQIPGFLHAPHRYLQLLNVALRRHSLLEFAIASEFSRSMRRVGISHIHSHSGDRKLYTGYFCSRILDVPLTVTVHAYEILMNPNPEMFKVAAAHCTRVVTVSEFNKKEIHRVYGVPVEQIQVIRIHGDMSDDRLRRSVKGLIVADFREKKGHEILFKALKKLGRDDIMIWVVGGVVPGGALDVQRMAEEIGVSHLTLFLGRQGKDILNILYDACDFFVLPSHTTARGDREGLPVALMEAMSHRKPAISTRHVGIPELLPDILVDENDVEGLAEAIAYIADNPQVRADLGERNYQIIKRDYSDPAALQLRELFEPESASEASETRSSVGSTRVSVSARRAH